MCGVKFPSIIVQGSKTAIQQLSRGQAHARKKRLLKPLLFLFIVVVNLSCSVRTDLRSDTAAGGCGVVPKFYPHDLSCSAWQIDPTCLSAGRNAVAEFDLFLSAVDEMHYDSLKVDGTLSDAKLKPPKLAFARTNADHITFAAIRDSACSEKHTALSIRTLSQSQKTRG